MKKHKILKLIISSSLALIITTAIAIVPFSERCESIRGRVFRLHILANSDENFDQELKLKIRDRLLEVSETLFENAETKEEAIEISKENIELLRSEAEKVIIQNGYDYPVTVTVGKAYFGTREYKNFTLPAGEYEALKVVIGKGEGKNWWCVMFPALCIPSSTDTIEDALEKKDAEIVKGGVKYKPAFKLIEIFEDIKHFFAK